MKMNNQELWKQCARWLKDVGVLSEHHRVFQYEAKMFDLAQTLRDGVVLSNVLIIIDPSITSQVNVHFRPQMSQFLCTQNLWLVVNCLRDSFGIVDTFHPSDLYHMTNFAKVLHTLSKLSLIPFVANKVRPFPEHIQERKVYNNYKEEDIYNSLAELAIERELADEEDLYDSVAEEKEEDGIYGSLIAVKRTSSIKDSKDIRSCCIKEIFETEQNYVNHLDIVCNKFMYPLKIRGGLSDKDASLIFINSEELLPVHQGFLETLHRYRSGSLSKPFIDYKEKFLIYGKYCSQMLEAQEHLDSLMKRDFNFKTLVEELQNVASPSKFRLRELLCVPMQRVLKYHLLVKELNKHTPEVNPDKLRLSKALEAMQELSHFVNEVKRDNEMNLTISKVQSCLVDFSDHLLLNSYGRLLKDGELKVKVKKEKGREKSKLRNIFLFDQALLMTKEDNGKYHVKDILRFEEEDFVIERTQQNKASKWNHNWILQGRGSTSYELIAKTELDKSKWVEQINTAFDNITPQALKNKQYKFRMFTFEKPTYCDSCHKLLLGSFFQGYYCDAQNVSAHKNCLSNIVIKMESNISLSEASSPSSVTAPPLSLSQWTFKQEKNKQDSQLNKTAAYKAHRPYKGDPPPPFSCPIITFETGEEIQIEEIISNEWWKGRALSTYDLKGLFPASFVSPIPMSIKRSKSNSVNKELVKIQHHQQPLDVYTWYAGDLDRVAATEQLSGKPNGTFLVREKNQNNYALSLTFEKAVKHIRIVCSPENLFYLAECKNFRSVQELISYYEETNMSTSFFGLDTTLKFPFKDAGFVPTASKSPLPPSLYPKNQSKYKFGYLSKPDVNVGRVLYDFESRSEQELGLRAGQTVVIVSKKGDSRGWWKVECEGKLGYVPARFIGE